MCPEPTQFYPYCHPLSLPDALPCCSLDIFVEPMLPRPEMVVFGASPVACAIADLAARSGYAVTVAALAEDQDAIPDAVRRIEGLALPGEAAGERFIVVATQGKRDADALRAAPAPATTRSEKRRGGK